VLYLTDAAAEKFFEIRRSSERTNAALRVAVLGGDCAGLKYHIGLEDFRAAGDFCVSCRGIDIYVDCLSAPYLWESQIDWMEVDGESGFVVFNPNQGRSRGGCSNDGSGQGCMTLGDGKHCIKEKNHACNCNADKTEIVYRIG
jgi:iron-sulfur cluster assembly protein